MQTCLVIKPYPREEVHHLLKKLQVYRLSGEEKNKQQQNGSGGGPENNSGGAKEDGGAESSKDNNQGEGGEGDKDGDKRMSNSPKLPPIGS